MKYLERLEVGAGYVLFEKGAKGDDLFFVESGRVSALLTVAGEAAPRRLRSMGAGTVVGEMGLYLSIERTATVVTEQESVLYRLTKKALADIEAQDLELACALHRFFIRLLSERLSHANEELAVAGR